MATNSKLIEEIRNQLQHDILSYGWLRQIARQYHPLGTSTEISALVRDAVQDLASKGDINLGIAKEMNDRAVIVPWSVEMKESLAKLEETISATNPEEDAEDGYAFWIGPKP